MIWSRVPISIACIHEHHQKFSTFGRKVWELGQIGAFHIHFRSNFEMNFCRVQVTVVYFNKTPRIGLEGLLKNNTNKQFVSYHKPCQQKKTASASQPPSTLRLSGEKLSHEKNPITFHYTGCLKGILVIYNGLL